MWLILDTIRALDISDPVVATVVAVYCWLVLAIAHARI